MKRTDLSIIMRTAWQMCRATGVTFAECLHKAWQVFKLKIKMRAGIVQFFYLKSSTGELRQAFGTLKDDLCPETKGDDRKPNKHLVTYYDTVAEGWRGQCSLSVVDIYGHSIAESCHPQAVFQNAMVQYFRVRRLPVIIPESPCLFSNLPGYVRKYTAVKHWIRRIQQNTVVLMDHGIVQSAATLYGLQ